MAKKQNTDNGLRDLKQALKDKNPGRLYFFYGEESFLLSYHLDRLKKLSSIDWNTANVSARHSYGLEKMNVCDMTRAAQSHVPEGMASLLVFRATGDNHVFLGYREENVFILLIYLVCSLAQFVDV